MLLSIQGDIFEMCNVKKLFLFCKNCPFFAALEAPILCNSRYVEASTSGHDIAVYKVDPSPLEGKMVCIFICMLMVMMA